MKITAGVSAGGLIALAFVGVVAAGADTVEARCDIYPVGEDQASASIACTFSQRQGYIKIERSDGVVHQLEPIGDEPGNFVDQDGSPVYRQSGLGDDGVIFRLADESIFLFWDASGLESGSEPSLTAPYDIAHYDATTLAPCSLDEPSHDRHCPAGILRGEPGAATIHVQSPSGEERILDFKDGEVTVTNGARLTWTKDGDEWHIVIDDREFLVVSEAMIFGD